METPIIVLAYAVAGLVATLVTLTFKGSIDRTLHELIPPELAPAWTLFVKFALFAVAFTGGMPFPSEGRYVGFVLPAVTLPVPGEGLNLVMKSAAGALKSASWLLLAFFAATLAAHMIIRMMTAFQKRREEEARQEADNKAEAKREKEKQDKAAEARMDAGKRQEPGAARPVQKEVSRPVAARVEPRVPPEPQNR